MDEQPDTFTFREDEAITPQHVEYYWDCRLDEIPLDDLCKGLAQLKAAGITVDQLLILSVLMTLGKPLLRLSSH